MSGSIPPNLILSLIFGVGQIVVGGGLAWYGLAPARWRQWRAVFAGMVGLWFFISGVCELIVSGMELSQRLGGGPSAAVFAQTRGLADGVTVCCDGRAGGWVGGVLHRNGSHEAARARPGGK